MYHNKHLNGFRNNRSTINNISFIHQKITGSHQSAVIFFDFEKAFELANPIILDILISYGIAGRTLSWIHSFLENRKAKVRIEGVDSSIEEFDLGTPQGSVLSPFLFNMIMNKIISEPLKDTDSLSFADDLGLVITGRNNLNGKIKNALKKCENLFTKYGLKVNFTKTKILIFGYKCRATFHLFDKTIEIVRQYNYLGIIFANKGQSKKYDDSFHKHFLYIKDRISKRVNLLKAMC